MDFPRLQRQQRLSANDRERLGRQLLERYTQGASIRRLCGETGYSIGRVRRLLVEAGVEFRARGGPTRSRKQDA